MNPLHSHDILDNLLDTVVHPFDIEGYQLGSDPLTHKKMRENANKGANAGGASSTSSNQSASDNSNSATKEDSSTTNNKMDETKDVKETSRSGS